MILSVVTKLGEYLHNNFCKKTNKPRIVHGVIVRSSYVFGGHLLPLAAIFTFWFSFRPTSTPLLLFSRFMIIFEQIVIALSLLFVH
ncbi:hypothetical protein LDENG_00185760 [Lucifuga dentata]|nr:hypothetical protein LDENG_00185760 [Lucifuga dentata]